MKIDKHRIDLEPAGTVRPETVRDERAATVERSTSDSRPDQVRVSSTSQLAAAAAAAATQAPDVRPEAVARGRALLDSGELGKDATRLAEALIDSLIDRR